jgi:predicted membrane GTPase involved in stress response
MGVEEAIEWIADDEPLEATPHPIRVAKILEQCGRPIRRRNMTAERSLTAVLGNDSAMTSFG